MDTAPKAVAFDLVGALARLRRHCEDGRRLILASANLDLYATGLGKMLGFDVVICTRAAFHD